MISTLFGDLFGLLAIPLGWLLKQIYALLPNYFLALFVFTLIMRIVTFPLALRSQKAQADRIRLAPKLERLQKKYGDDRMKLQKKQQELYEKEGVSLTGGCLPMLLNFVLLFGILAVIYSPLTYLANIPKPVINATMEAMKNPANADGKEIKDAGKISWSELSGYYAELRVMQNIQKYETDVKASIAKLSDEQRKGKSAETYYNEIVQQTREFDLLDRSLLQNPWTPGKGFADISILWLIPLFSALTAALSSYVSMRFSRMGMSQSQLESQQGCSNVMMLLLMPMMSLFFTFAFPGGVGVYWIFSNVLAVGQTYLLNTIYNPKKIREQAEREYEERRRQRAEDKKRLSKKKAEAQQASSEQPQTSDKQPPATKQKPSKKVKKALEVDDIKEDLR